ncbi:MAG: LpqB family beta-propeller domain-containing protein [Actinomycetes bacterium]
MAERSARRLVAVLATAALLAPACATVPTSGPVREGAAVVSGGKDKGSAIRVVPQPPQEGEDPLAVVEGFLDASASFDDGHRYARLHLDPETSADWDPDEHVVVYEASEQDLHAEEGNTVVLEASRLATIDAQGQYTPAPPGATVQAEFRLRRVAGEWRIADLPQGMFLTRNDMTRSFRSVNLYYPSPGQQVLVPDPVYLPLRRPGLPTVATQSLLGGPTDWLAPAVANAIPRGTRLAGTHVDVDSQGVATVDLTSLARRASDEGRQALSAQVVWTLRQFPEVTGVRIAAQGSALDVPEAGAVQSRDAWSSWRPDALPADAVGYFVQRGRLVALRKEGPSPLPASQSDRATPLREPAVSPDLTSLAALSVSADRLRRGPLGPREQMSTVLSGTRLTRPTWDLLGAVWTVENPPGTQRPQVWSVPPSGPPRRVEAAGLGDAEVLAFRIARDGTRAAVVTVSGGVHRLLVGRIVRGSRLRLEALRDVTGPLVEMRDVSWASGDVLAVVGRDAQSGMQAWAVDVDGSHFDSRGSVPGMESIAAAPAGPSTRPLLVGTEDGQVYQSRSRGTWQRLDVGTDPLYPG